MSLNTIINKICAKCGKEHKVHEDYAFGEPICLNCKYPNETKSSAQEIIITPAILDISNLNESNEFKEYRPSSFDEYIGQESAKEKVKSFIEGCKKFNEIYPHTFISAPSGMGKTLFASILAKQLNKNIIFTTGGELKSEQIFIDKLVEADGGIIFVDEANRLPKRVGFFILPLMEQFEIQGKAIKKFTLIFATTHKGDISKDLDALIQRCEQINLVPYTNDELKYIILQYKNKQYPSINISEDILKEIINSSRQTPRNAKNLIRAYAYIMDWNKIKQFNNLIKDGLTDIDIKTMKYLQNNEGAGNNAIANHLRVKSQTYLWDIEPYLIYKNFIKIENKRQLTEDGINFLQDLEYAK